LNSVLITGGSGSFGRAFTKLLLEQGVQRICVLSRGELRQAEMCKEFSDDPRLRFFIGDVRDRDRLRRAMEGCDTVIHAAALKRIEVGFYNPIEMCKTNVYGTMNVIEAAQDAAIERVVMLSTDKAWQPVSAYGHSKALAESLVLAANHTRGNYGPIFAVTRYGNIACSSGSVIPTWRALQAGGVDVVPVTDPACTRFWMTLDDATALVLQTVRTMRGGELVTPELPAYRLGDLADAMDVEMDIKGLRPWEKLHEGMRDGLTSDRAYRMSVQELKTRLAHV
jgi:FlaA1/EpsC-like NDP-sugar epimerase